MKKILTYILITFTLLITISNTVTYAQSTIPENLDSAFTSGAKDGIIQGNDATVKNNYNLEYTPSVIPKPNFLPGPEVSGSKTERETLTTKFLPKLTVTIIGFAGVAALIVLLISGVRFSLNLGSDDEITKAKDHIIYAIIGLIVAMLSYTIVKITINLDFNDQAATSQVIETMIAKL